MHELDQTVTSRQGKTAARARDHLHDAGIWCRSYSRGPLTEHHQFKHRVVPGTDSVELAGGSGEGGADMLLVSQRGRPARGDLGARLDTGLGVVQVACPAGYVDLHCHTW